MGHVIGYSYGAVVMGVIVIVASLAAGKLGSVGVGGALSLFGVIMAPLLNRLDK